TSGEAQTAAVRAIVEHVRGHFAQFPQLAELPQPFRVDPLPGRIGLSEVHALPLLRDGMAEGPVVAVGGDRLSRITIDWPEAGGFVVVGDRRSGRTHALAAIAHQLGWRGTGFIVVAREGSILAEVARSHGAAVLAPQSTEEQVAEALAAGEAPLTVVVDDSETIRDTPVDRALSAARGQLRFIVAVGADSAGSSLTMAFTEAKKGRIGLLLSPPSTIVGTQVFGQQLPRTYIGRAAPGAGVLFVDGSYMPVQVPDLTA
ncbi:MAG: hypothetical protein GX539_07765, partial [Candidatus Cloacimonetes bacterium]|nr:hypothetical protein [Candidatus Cloacimonadota bacterium]